MSQNFVSKTFKHSIVSLIPLNFFFLKKKSKNILTVSFFFFSFGVSKKYSNFQKFINTFEILK